MSDVSPTMLLDTPAAQSMRKLLMAGRQEVMRDVPIATDVQTEGVMASMGRSTVGAS